MIIAGSQNLSLVDFPGYLAAVVFVQGCNFRCPYCQNPDLVTLDKHFDFPEKEFFDYISRRKSMIEGVVITGGEPTIYRDLPDLARRIKDLGLKVKLDTNGTNPSQLEELFRAKHLDYLSIDIKTAFSKYHLVTSQDNAAELVLASIRLAMLSTVPYEFRITCVPGIVGEEDLPEIGGSIKGAKKCCLQQFRPLVTYDKSFQDVRPYSPDQMRKFAKILEAFAEKVEIRGI